MFVSPVLEDLAELAPVLKWPTEAASWYLEMVTEGTDRASPARKLPVVALPVSLSTSSYDLVKL